jgi:signal transduction histidine kinase/ActR/RegA family two-component response regulator
MTKRGKDFYYAWGSGVPADFAQRVQSFPLPPEPTLKSAPDALNTRLQNREGMVITEDVQALAALPNADLYAEMDLRTTINVLLQREGRLIGRLNIGTIGETRQFSLEELAVLRGLADHAVTAIENARLYQESQRQAAMLEAVNKIIATIVLAPNLQSLLDTALTHILQALSLPIGMIWTSNRQATQGLRPDATSLIAHIVQGAEASLLPDVVVVTDRQQVTVDDPAYAFAHSAGRIGLTASFFIPMVGNSWQLGGIIVGQSTPRVWNADEIALMRAVGQQLNTAIERFYLRKREQDQARQVQQILEMAPEGMVLLDEEQRVILANPAGRKYLELLGVDEPNARLLHLGNEPIAAFLDLPTAPLTWHEIIIDTPQRHIFEIMARPLTDSPISEEGNGDDRPGYVLVLRDVTQERQRSDYLQTQERLATVGQLAAGIAHDFNNILTPILLYTDMSMSRIPQDSRIQASLQQVLIAANRAKDLIQQILAFGRHGTKQGHRVLQLQPVIKETLKLLRAVLPATIEIEQRIGENVGPVLADATQIHQILMNLCTNAYHAMSARGGILSVELDLVEVDTNFAAKQGNLRAGNYVRLSVRDTGYGMDRAVLAHIFDPFFTTKPVGEGTGMGLSVVYGIVMEHKGAITVESQPGRGSTFQIYLAQMDADVESEAKREEPVARGHERILVVDDEETVAQVVKESLENAGYQVTICTDSVEALELFRANPKQFDLVLSDLTMPRMTGLELVRKIAAIQPHLPIILTSGYGSDLTAEITSELSVRAYLMKPFAQNVLGQTIRQVLDRKN